MVQKIYNTLSRKKEVFRPRKPPRVGVYICGPTVYGPGHIGHARTYVVFDVIRRYLEYQGYKVKYIMNITDIHDDIVKEAIKRGIPFQKLAAHYSKQFLKETDQLGIKRANANPRVTRCISDIIKFIKKLMKKNYAYEEKGSVYFDVSKFKDYGKLSGIKLKEELAGTRIKSDKYEREEAADFVLWKAVSPVWSRRGKKFLRGPGWPSPWPKITRERREKIVRPGPEERSGLGRPGWHIECTVISQKYLGEQFDIHGGGIDLIFPHHENEIAQSEAGSGKKPFVKYWLHAGLLTVEGRKMSKSLGNYIEINQALKKWPARVLRFFFLNSHYRSGQDYNEKALWQAKRGIERIDEFLDKLEKIKGAKNKKWEKLGKSFILPIEKELERAMDDDFNTPKALSSIFRLISRGNQLFDKGKLTPPQARAILAFFKKIDRIFNFIFWGKRVAPKIPSFIKKMVREREEARKRGNFQLADEIRRKIQWQGYKIEDTKEGPKIKKIS